MPSCALTSELLAGLPLRVPRRGSVNYFDTETKGFMLEHRASGGATWYFRYRDAGGVVRQQRIGAYPELPLAQARVRALQMRERVDAGQAPQEVVRPVVALPTLAEFVASRYLPYVQSRKRSWALDEVLLRLHVLPGMGNKRLDEISRHDVLTMHETLRQGGYAAGTCNRVPVLVKYVFNCAIRWEVLEKNNPCANVPLFEDRGARERYLSPDEVQRLFAELDRSPQPQIGQIIRLLLFTGARKREVLDARWEHVDMERRLLTVPLSKSGKKRHIPLSDAAMEVLQGVQRQPDMPWVFFNPRTRLPWATLFASWDAARRRAGLAEVRMHDLRHSFASFLVNSGRSLYEVQRLLGHHDPKVTMRYAHLSPAALIEAANAVGQALSRTLV